MSVAEIETAVREGVHLVVLVWVDGGYGLIGWKQDIHFGRRSAVSFANPDFVRLAESFGAKGYAIASADELAADPAYGARRRRGQSIDRLSGGLRGERAAHRAPRRAHRPDLIGRSPGFDAEDRIESEPAPSDIQGAEGILVPVLDKLSNLGEGRKLKNLEAPGPAREHVRARGRGPLRRGAAGEDRRVPRSGSRTASRSTTCCPRPSPRCERPRGGRSASVTSTCS